MIFVRKLLFVLVGLFLTALGINILFQNLLTFGGTAGIATLLTYVISLSWGVLFFIVNLPFFIISLKELGKWFTLSSFISIIGISVMSDSLQLFIPAFQISNLLATVMAGVAIGIGVTFVLNNGSSLGGIHILALYLDKKFGFNRGVIIFLCDSAIILVAAQLVGWQSALYSILSIFIASFIIGRYKSSPIKNVVTNDEVIVVTNEKIFNEK